MASREAGRKRRDARRAPQARGVLNHPWRVRIIEVLSERDMSVAQFVDEGLIPDLADEPRDEAISLLAYHFRKLKHAGLVHVVEAKRVRGSNELICRAGAGALHDDEEWAKLSLERREGITPMTLHSLIGRAEGAIIAGTFDARDDRHLAWLALELDEQAWNDLRPVLNGVLEVVTAVQQEAGERLKASGEPPIRATWGQLLFESPLLPASESDEPPG